MKSNKNTIINGIIFIILIFITYFLIFKNQNIYDLYNNIIRLNITYILLALFTMFIYYLIEAINIKLLLNSFGEKTTIIKTLKYTLIGFFFSSITPAATGGQPMEVYYMSKDNISISHGTMALLIHICGFQMSTVFLGIIGAIIAPHVLNNGLLYLFIIGSIINTIPITLTFVCIYSKKASKKIMKLAIKLFHLLNLKSADRLESKINHELELFAESSNYIKKHKNEFIRAICIAFIQILVYYTIPFIVYKSFNLNEYSIITFIMFQAILHSSACSMPLPGSVGVTETVFLVIYGIAYPIELIQSAVLITRFTNFYIYVIIGLIVFLINKIKKDKKNN